MSTRADVVKIDTTEVDAGQLTPPLVGAPAMPTDPPLRRHFEKVLPPLIAGTAFLVLWHVLHTQLPERRQFLLPSPVDVLVKGFLDPDSGKELLSSLLLTAELALTGLTVSVVLGMLTSILMWRFFWIERASYPFLVALQAVPILAIAPLMTIAFGYGFMSKALVCVIISFFPIPTTMLLGMKSIDKRLIDLFRMHQASTWTTLWKLAIPNSLPSLFTGFRIAAGASVIGAIVGEQFFKQGEAGLGQRLEEYRVLFQYEQLYAALILSSLLGIAVFLAFGWLGHRLTRHWHESAS